MSTRSLTPLTAAPVAVLVPQQRPVLQRTCDCGQHTGGGECADCMKKKKIPLQRQANGSAAPAVAPPIVHQVLRTPGQPLDASVSTTMGQFFARDFSGVPLSAPSAGLVQRKLTISAIGDRYEQEADRVAKEVMHMPESGTTAEAVPSAHSPSIHALPSCSSCQKEFGVPILRFDASNVNEQAWRRPSTDPSVLEADILRKTQESGEQLTESDRAFFEPRFGRDFSRVRVHADASAAATSDTLSARAFTLGSHIMFASGQYSPETMAGRQLLAHELTHVVQQGGQSSVQETQHVRRLKPRSRQLNHVPRTAIPGASSIRLILPNGTERFIGPPSFDASGAQSNGSESKDTEVQEQTLPGKPSGAGEKTGGQIQRMPASSSQHLLIQRSATFTNPTPQPLDPLARFAAGEPPGLTTPTINGTVIANSGDVLNQVSPTKVVQTGSSQGKITCQFDPSFAIDTSANMIVASNAGPKGWVGNVPAAVLQNPPQCAGKPQIPATMNAQPSNADFVARVRASEGEHAQEIRALHNRHFVPYDKFLLGLSGTGADLSACGSNLVGQLAKRNVQAAYGFVFGYAAATKKLDGPGGTHSDNAAPAFAANCASVDIVLSQSNPTIPGSGPGNVVSVPPTVTTFNPAQLKVVGADIQDGNTTIKHFSSAANANQGLQVLRHYGMTSRNVIGAMEYFLVGNNAPNGPLAGASELSINPAAYQVSLDVPSRGDWAITDVVGNNVNVVVNFGAARNEAYSAWAVMTQLVFTKLCWVGGSRQKPEMMYFRT